MRRLGISFQVDINRTEQYPFAVGRDDGLPDPLEPHHIFEGERVFTLGQSRNNQERDDYQAEKTVHNLPPWGTESV